MTGALVHLAEPAPHGRWLRFAAPREVVVAWRHEEVLPALEQVVAARAWAVGYVAYDAASAFDPALVTRDAAELPLAWWGIFPPPTETATPVTATEERRPDELHWQPAIDRARHAAAVATIRRAIARGEVYQVNLTFPLLADFSGDPQALFATLWRAQRRGYGAYLDTGRFAICSASPELFVAAGAGRVVSRPMKGTARRGRFPAEDDELAADLAASAKERAENVMIVDMVRNDLGRIAATGSVEVERLWQVETYPTVHQLVSTVAARSEARLPALLAALFPAASITGAPKIAAMRLIRDLEAAPRGVYTGTVGVVAPDGRLQLNVAIRTATVDRERGTATYGTGGGITWDSVADDEYEECRAKARILRPSPPPFWLVETLRWEPSRGAVRRLRHLERLAASALHFAIPLDAVDLDRQLDAATADLPPCRHRLRLTVAEDGRVAVETTPWTELRRSRWRVGLALAVDGRPPARSDDLFLFHKTTHREIYRRALATRPDCDEVILWNERGELTEATRANLVLDLDGELVTPALDAGLLPGILRGALLARRRVVERPLPRAAFGAARRVYLVNSLRGWIGVERVAHPADAAPAGAARHIR